MMVPQGMRDPLDFFCDKLPRKCKACQGSRNAHSFTYGRHKLHKEINIVEQIREQRYFKSAMKLLLSRRDRKLLLHSSQYKTLRLDKQEDLKRNQPIPPNLEKPSQLQLQTMQDIISPALSNLVVPHQEHVLTQQHTNYINHAEGQLRIAS